MNHRLRAVLVTGGNRGIGAASAVALAQRGHPVAIVYRQRQDEAAAVVDEITRSGGEALAIRADVAVEDDVIGAFAQARERFGVLGGLVNNAGITGGPARLADLSASQLHETLLVNVQGAFFCARAFARQAQGGSIVNVSSRAAAAGGGGVWVHYAATKGAMDTMTIGLARELGSAGIRVNAVRPGLIDTEIHDSREPGQLDRLVQGVPLGRLGRADEVAHAIVWLLSEDASYVTGALLDVSGGT